MRRHSFAFRLSTATALAGMLIGAAGPVMAQPAPGPELAAPGTTAPTQAAGDPPARVGRVARIGGTVSFHTSDATQWEAAQLNEPVTNGNSFWTQPAASTDIEVGGTRVVLDQTSEFTVDQLDDQTFNATAAQGRIYLRVREIQPGENTTIRTPRGAVVITAPGRYEVAVGDTETPTLVTVDQGVATITAPGVNLSISDHQTAQVTGTDNFNGVVVAEQRDDFLNGQMEREHPPRAIGSAPPPPVVQQMTGYDAVADTGQWATDAEYGQVWYPPVAVGWAPYREGHWAFVAPWGWTWIDDASWGFAPFHYGRWAQFGPRWGWVPYERGGYVEARPVYAPALVAFVGVGAGIAIGVGIGAAMGWIPLGPREPYHPPYGVSAGYFNRVNVTNVTNINNIRNVNVTNVNYVNARGGATVAPGSAFQNSQNLRGVAQPLAANQVASLQPLARPSVTPTRGTQGVTPAVARSMNLPTAPGDVGGARQSPGPAFQSHPASFSNGANAGAAPSPQLPHPGGFNAGAGAARSLPQPPVHGAAPAPTTLGGPQSNYAHPQATQSQEPRTEQHSAPQAQSRPEPQATPRVEPHQAVTAPAPRPAAQAQPRPEPRAEPRPALRPESRPESRPEPRQEPRAEARPAPHPAPAPAHPHPEPEHHG